MMMFMSNPITVTLQYLFLRVDCYPQQLRDCNVEIFLADFANPTNFQSLGTFQFFTCQQFVRVTAWNYDLKVFDIIMVMSTRLV